VVAERVGVPTATLRSWNQRYGVGPTDHSPGRHRLYSENDIAIVGQMHELIGQGASPRSAARAAIDLVRPVRGDTSALLSAAFALDTAVVGRLLDRHVRHFGVLDTWDEFIRPAFVEIEARQAAGEGCIDVEHALSWTVSRALQRSPMVAPDEASTVILACMSGETHTLALEALRAALAERGHGALMLGADVPRAALLDAVTRSDPRVTAVMWSQTSDTADEKTIAEIAIHAEVIVCGPGWGQAPPDTVLVESLGVAIEHLTADD
jgi:DNA-binding transcriptional MerR regulator